ncbi:unnamed protein product, partial [marine sediment metagenome]
VISVNKTVLTSRVNESDIVEFMINITNTGPTNLTEIILYDYFNESEIYFENVSCDDFGGFNFSGGWFNLNITKCHGSDLGVNDSYVVYVNFTALTEVNSTNYAEVNATDWLDTETYDSDNDTVEIVPGDAYEDDDVYTIAKTISTDGTEQYHTFIPAGDHDWVKFSASAGAKYIIQTSDLRNGADTVINLTDTDGTTYIAGHDDIQAGFIKRSKITWTATGTGTYYVEVSDYNASHSAGAYNISITEVPNVTLEIDVTSTTVQKGVLFNVTVNATCYGINCNNIDIYLDPEEEKQKKSFSQETDLNLLERVEELPDEEFDVIIVMKDVTEEEMEANKAPKFGVQSAESDAENPLAQRKAAVEEKQNKILSTLGISYGGMAAMGASSSKFTLGRRYNVINMLSGAVTKEGLEALRNDPNVESVQLSQTYTIMLDNSTKLINADDAWATQLNGINITGTGQTVCIIDSGIDYTHADFGGYGSFPNAKIIGGYDFFYDDNDPTDEEG